MKKISVFNPYAETISEFGIDRVLAHTDTLPNPFLQLLGARWLHAQRHDTSGRSETVTQVDHDSDDTIVLPDFFLGDLIRSFGSMDAVQRYDGIILVFSDLTQASETAGIRKAAMNSFLSARSGPYDRGLGFHYMSFNETGGTLLPVVPMGCGASWLKPVDHDDKVIFLDEPHMSLVDILGTEHDVRTRLFKHALEVCRILSRKGFRIVTFSRTSSPVLEEIYREHDYLDVVGFGSWIAFSEIVTQYARASLFFSFFTESFGYSIYENMQLGNGVISYFETFDPYRAMHMQKGALISIYNSPDVCADVVDEFYERYRSLKLRRAMAESANRDYSAETFLPRLRSSKAFRAMSSS